jgi:hypothetical protein
VSCFSDKDINEDREDGDKEGWEQVDVNKAEEMAKKEASPAPRMPDMTAATPPKKTQAVARIEKDMKIMAMVDGPKFVSFNFNHRFMLTAPVMIYLEDGSHQVYYDYLVNTQVGENFNMTVS